MITTSFSTNLYVILSSILVPSGRKLKRDPATICDGYITADAWDIGDVTGKIGNEIFLFSTLYGIGRQKG